MAQIDLGKLKFQWQGLWQTATAYEVDDVVHDDGSTFVVVTAVPDTNNVRPGENDSFELMARGVNFRGEYDAQATYLHLEVVTHNLASWISIQSVAFTGQEPVEGSTFWALLTPAPAENVMTDPGDMVYVDNEGNNQRLPISTEAGVSLVVARDPRQTFERGGTYSVGTNTPATAILTDIDDNTNVVGDNDTNGTITVTRGFTYTFVFPANFKSYSIKNPEDANYTTLGGGGRLASAVVPTFVSNGGTIKFSPDVNTPNTVVIRDELGGTDEITVNVVDMRYSPRWQAGSVRDYAPYSLGNANYNTYTESLLPLPAALKKFGRGNCHAKTYNGHWQNQYITKGGDLLVWGNNYNDGVTYDSYNSNSLGSGTDGIIEHPMRYNIRWPGFWMRALAGDPNEAKWLTDEAGNDLGYGPASHPKIVKSYRSNVQCYVLTENGLLFNAGYNGYSGCGNGINTNNRQLAHVVQFYDQSNTALVGADRPRITQFNWSGVQDSQTTTANYWAIDSDGFLYGWGYNQYGQLADGTQTNNWFARRINPQFFNNERVIFVSCTHAASHMVAVITETGKCFTWGRAVYGGCGTGSNPAFYGQPQDVTAISGSPLLGKKIMHVHTQNSNQDIQKTWYLTTEGQLYYSGYCEAYGAYTGVWQPSNAHILMPTLLTDSNTTYLSDNQRAVAFWHTGGRYGNGFILTDGGDANQPKVYGFGGNQNGRNGTDANISNTASATVQGEWFLREIRFETAGDSELSANTNNNRPNSVVGTQYDATLAGDMVIGRIIKVGGNGNGDDTAFPVVALDDNGRLWTCGYKSDHNWVGYVEWDQENDWRAGEDYGRVFYPSWSQPEPAVDFNLIHASSGNSTALQFIGESGTIWYAGHTSYNAHPNNKTAGAWSPLPHMIGGY